MAETLQGGLLAFEVLVEQVQCLNTAACTRVGFSSFFNAFL